VDTFIRLVMALVVVFSLLFALRYYLLRRAAAFTSSAARVLRVRERVWLSGRTQAIVLEVGEEAYLVCTTGHTAQVLPLGKLPALPPAERLESQSFAAHFEQMLTFLRQGGNK